MIDMATTHNVSVKSIWDQCNIFIAEMGASASANTQDVLDADKERIKATVNALKEYSAKVLSQNKLDLPNVHPSVIALGAVAEKTNTANKFINELCLLVSVTRDQLQRSSSSNISHGLLHFDHKRFDAGVGNIDSYVTEYLDQIEPLDEPETTKNIG